MPSGLVNLDNQNTVGIFLGHELEKALKTVGVAMGELIEKVLSCRWFNHPVQVGGFECPMHFADWFHPTGGDASPGQCFQAKATLILTEESDCPRPSQLNRHKQDQDG